MFNSVGSIMSAYHASPNSHRQSKVVDKMFEKVDANQDGQITKDELAQSLASSKAPVNSSGKKLSVDEIFQVLDSAGKGYITKEDAAAGLGALAEKLTAARSKKPAEVAPAGDGAGTGAAAGGGTATGTVYDPRDTNQDGTVSMEEELAYNASQYATAATLETTTQAASTATYA